MREDPAMRKLSLATALAVTGIGLVACGSGTGGHPRTVTVTRTATSAQQTSASPAGGDAILIETRITNAMQHAGKVVVVFIGESAYCRGAESSGGSAGPTITSTLQCPEGTLKLQYAPTQRSLVQGATWRIASGTGTFKGLHGGGSMVAKFQSENPDRGQEIFTGTVGK